MPKKSKPTEPVRIKTELVNRARKIAAKKDTTIRAVIERKLSDLPK